MSAVRFKSSRTCVKTVSFALLPSITPAESSITAPAKAHDFKNILIEFFVIIIYKSFFPPPVRKSRCDWLKNFLQPFLRACSISFCDCAFW
jgi:hypothetical protein